MAEEITTLVTERGRVKAALTRFKNYFETSGRTATIASLQERLDRNIPLYDKFDNIQSRIETHVSGTNLEAAQALERTTFEDMYFDLVSTIRERIQASNSEISNASRSNTPGAPALTDAQLGVKLPTITLPTFDGSYDNWLKFRDTFESLINSNDTLSSIQKFHYLNSSLTGNAARVIQSLGVSEANYLLAWRNLKERFEDSNSLVHHHTKALFELPAIGKEQHSMLRQLLDDTNNHLLALKSLGEPVDAWDTLVIHLVSTKLDAVTKREWEKRLLGLVGKPMLRDLVAFLERHCKYLERFAADKQPVANNNHKTQGKSGNNNKFARDHVSSNVATTKATCPLCKKEHQLYKCDDFKSLAPTMRVTEAQRLQVCFNCLLPGHRNKVCHFGPCRKCSRRHNTLLHPETNSTPITTGQGSPSAEEPAGPPAATSSTQALSVVANSDRTRTNVILSTALVFLQDRQGNNHECRALLDSGSQSHFVTQDLCRRLDLPCTNANTTVSGNQQITRSIQYRTNVRLSSRCNSFKVSLACLVLPRITDDMPRISISANSLPIPANLMLADPHFDQTRQVDMLIGAGLFWDLLCIGQVKLGPEYPLLQKTQLGWIMAGGFAVPNAKPQKTSCHLVTNDQLHAQVAKFWEIENTGAQKGLPLDNKDFCEQHFTATTTRDKDGRFAVSIPFTDKVKDLGDSRQIAEKRLRSLERKLDRQPDLKTQYIEFLNEYERLGHMTKVTTDDGNKATYYLPHHAVIREDNTTTKVRVVFDGSCKTTSGLSLNDVQRVGPIVQNDLFSILLRFRQHPYVISADVAKMYRQIKVQPEQRGLQRILWRPEPSQPIQTYELNTVTYGTASAPYLATRCLRKLGEDHQVEFPEACNAIINDFYVDDLLTGANSIHEARELREQLQQILGSAGLELRKWASNDARILTPNGDANWEKKFDADQGSKTLGILWATSTDELRISATKPTQERVTKRSILSTVAQIYDPLGLVGPATIQAKIILQRLWQLQVTWDESLPQDVHSEWTAFHTQLPRLNQIVIPRQVLPQNCSRIELHGFCDASQKAYGTCIYLRCVAEDGTCTTTLLCAKSRVAPLKTVTLPRLELCGALLLAELYKRVKTASKLNIQDEHFWCDSTVALAWIKSSPSKWKTFVANRTAQIQELTNDNWHHVPTEDNPADIISRGINPFELVSATLWWTGPRWLSQDSSYWPSHANVTPEDVPEQKQSTKLLIATTGPEETTTAPLKVFEKYSSLTKVNRVLAYCLRFIRNVRNLVESCKQGSPFDVRSATERRASRARRDLNMENLSTVELADSMTVLLRLSQSESFSKELRELQRGSSVHKTSAMLPLNPFLDTAGLIRVGGRLANAHLPYNQKHPVILASKHPLTKLIVVHPTSLILIPPFWTTFE